MTTIETQNPLTLATISCLQTDINSKLDEIWFETIPNPFLRSNDNNKQKIFENNKRKVCNKHTHVALKQ